MKILLITTVLLVSKVLDFAGSPKEHLPMLRAGYISENILRDGSSDRECFVIHSNGSWHMELRHQQLPEQANKLSVYESELTQKQLQELRKLATELKSLKTSKYTPPSYPLSVSSFELFELSLQYDKEEHQQGYFYTTQKDYSLKKSSDEIQASWMQSRIALQPMIAWLDNLGWRNMKPRPISPTSCQD